MSDDAYALLGISPQASLEEATEAYRALAQIYHPDRYAGASERVQAEASKRMQALNAAFQQVRATAVRAPSAGGAPRSSTTPPARPSRRPPPPRETTYVHYVDGAKGFHNGTVAPLGFQMRDGTMQRIAGVQTCSKLDSELLAWFELQRRNASLSAQQMYQAWDDEEQARYAATLGCSQVARDGARALGVPCGECRP